MKILMPFVACVCIGVVLSAGPAHLGRKQPQNAQGSLAQPGSQLDTAEAVTASKVEYVDGPLAPLYDFLIQRRLQRFCKLLREANLEDVLQNLGGAWTLFAPTDSSFIFLPGGTVEQLQRNPALLREFLLHHFVTGDLGSQQFQNDLLVDTVQGSPLRFNIYGQIVTVSGAQILEPDLEFELGRVHIIDHPLYPIPQTDIVGYLQASHKQIYRLLVDTGLLEYISSGTFTFLAPDDQAFDFLSLELKEALATNTSLAERVLLNHILPGVVYVGGITEGMQWETLGGAVITFTTRRGLTFANGIPIVLPDIPVTNGVIHVLNRVLLPDGIEADCQCKPSSDTSRGHTPQGPGSATRPPFGQPQGPSFGGAQTARPGSWAGSNSRQTPRPPSPPRNTPSPFGGQRQTNRPISGQTNRPFTPPNNSQGAQTPTGPSRTGQLPRPGLHPSSTGNQPEDEPNSLGGPVDGTFSQNRPDQQQPTRYPQPPRQITTPRSQTQRPAQPPRRTWGGQQSRPSHDSQKGSQQIGGSQTPRPVNPWSNRQQTTTRYPTPVRGGQPSGPHRTTASIERLQTTSSYNRNTPRTDYDVTQTTQTPQQIFQTPRSNTRTTRWQQRNQVTSQIRTTKQPAYQTTKVPAGQRTTQPRPGTIPTSTQTAGQPFESNRQTPTCRRRNERVTPFTQSLPICPETSTEPCQSLPYNPTDTRPLCPEVETQDCRNRNSPYDPADRRPLCPTSGPNCKNPGDPTYPGDRRPFCTSSPSPSGCRDPAQPFNPSDTRPICPSSGPNCKNPGDPTYPGDRRPFCSSPPSPSGCRDPSQPFNPSDTRPVCPNSGPNCKNPGDPTYPGDRRPFCSPSPSQSGCRDPSQPFNPSDTRPVCQTCRRQGEAVDPSNPLPVCEEGNISESCRRPGEATYPQDTRPLCPDGPSTEQDCRPFLERPKPGDRRPVCKVNRQQTTQQTPKPFDGQNKVPKTQGNTRQPQHGNTQRVNTPRYPTQSTTRRPWQPSSPSPQGSFGQSPSIKTPPHHQPGNQPSSNPNLRPSSPQSSGHSSLPQSGVSQIQPSSDPAFPQTQAPFSPPGSGLQPSRPQSGSYPSQTQPGRQPSRPQSGSYPSQAQPGRQPSRPQSGPYPSQPQSSLQTSRPQSGSYTTRQPGPVSSHPGSGQRTPQTTSYPPPPRNVPHSPPTGSRPSSGRPGSSDVGPSRLPDGNQNPGSAQRRPVTPQRQPIGQFTPSPGHGSNTPRVPISVTGTSTTPGEDSRRSLYEIVEDPALLIRGHPVKLTRIFDLFHKAGIEDILTNPGPTTVFLPSDDAFALLPNGVVEQLEEYPELLRQVLLYHVTNTEILPTAQSDSYTVPSLQGTQLVVTMLNNGRLILVSGAKAIAVTRANNGIFYVINQLLYPLPYTDIMGAIRGRPDLTQLSSLLDMSGLSETLQGQTPYTLFAPTDDAFAQLPPAVFQEVTQNTTALKELLLNHLTEGAHYGREFIAGGTFPNARGGKLKFQVVSYGYKVNDVNIKTPEIVTGTGIIHLVDQVLLEPADLQLINRLDNSAIGEDGSINPDIPRIGGQLPPSGFQPAGGQSPNTNIHPNQPHSASNRPGQPQSAGNYPPGQPQFGTSPPRQQQTTRTYPNQPQTWTTRPRQSQTIGNYPGQPQAGTNHPGQPQTNGNFPGQPQAGTRRQGQPQSTGSYPGQPQAGTTRPGQSNTNSQYPGQPQPGANRPGYPQNGNNRPSQPHPAGNRPGQPQFGGQNPQAVSPRPGQSHSSSHLSPSGQRSPSGHNQPATNRPFGGQRQPVNQNPPAGQPHSTGHSQSPGRRPISSQNGQQSDVANLARSMGLNQFANWITNTGLLEKIHDGGVYTIFAPTDEAVNSLPDAMASSIRTNPEQVKPLLQYHIVPQNLNLNSITNEETTSTLLQGKNIRFNVYQNGQADCKQLVTASGTPIGESIGAMGTIQLIPVTQVLYQPTGDLQKIVDASPILQSLSQAVQNARLSWVLSGTGPVTFFAPSDAAFEALSAEDRKNMIDNKQAFTDLLNRHIIRGTLFSSGVQEDLEKKTDNGQTLSITLQDGIMTVNSVPVTYSDVTATNGVLHVIDKFL